MLTHLSLFSGIGGLDLAAEMAGFTTVGQCEWADYPTKILEKHWPDVPRWRDIRTLTGESFYERTGLRTVDVVSGGFPCQPFSVAGKQKGKDDNRYLWPEMLRVIRELAPRWVIGENVPGILRIAGQDVVADLEREGYDVFVFDFEAAAVGAWHRRERIAFVGHAEHDGLLSEPLGRFYPEDAREGTEREKQTKQFERTGSAGCDETVAHADDRSRIVRRDGKLSKTFGIEKTGRDYREGAKGNGSQKWSTQPGLGGVADGLSYWMDEPAGIPRVTTVKKNRADRLKCTGNAVVPQQFYPIFSAIAEIEEAI